MIVTTGSRGDAGRVAVAGVHQLERQRKTLRNGAPNEKDQTVVEVVKAQIRAREALLLSEAKGGKNGPP